MLKYIYTFIHVYYLFSNYEYLPLQMMPRLLLLQHPHSCYIETHSHGYHWIWPCAAEGNTCEEKKCLKMFTPGQKNIRKLRCVDVIDPVYGSHESLMQ